MKKLLLSLLCMTMSLANAFSQGFPTISTDEETKWYLIQFMNGGDALTANESGSQITISSATGSDTQLWKITGNETDGYTFTNKKGYTLYVNSATTEQMVNAATSPSGVSKFFITSTSHSIGGYELQPDGNTNISMNLWGGPGDSRACVGLWNKGDQNNPVKFVDASAFETMSKVTLIPYPQEIAIGNSSFDISKLNTITYNSDEMQGHIENFAEQLKKSSGIELIVKKAGSTPVAGEIWFGTDTTLPHDGYTLNVKENGIEIKAEGFGGELYALQTLIQLLPCEFFVDGKSDIEWVVPVVDIKDNPQFQHRGFMMDVARHFFDKDEVKKVLDIMALYKMNRLHWHLTDDQGWRIEIPEYPKLTEVGSIRSGSFTGNGDGASFFDDTEYGRGMWFSQDDLREIVAYATERNIDILPEIDLPGHMVAAVTAYPELSCDPTKEYSVRVYGGISKDVLNVGKDEVIDFLKCVLRNVAEIFPFPYIHLGGDECPTDQWQTNEDCLRRVQEENLSGVNELQSWLVEELGAYLETLGKGIVVWDEVLKHWNTNNKVEPVIMAWNEGGAKYAKQAADLGFNSILCPYSHVYIDFMQQNEDNLLVDEPYDGGWGVNTVERVYSLNPLTSLEGKEAFCWGAQCNLWSETLNDNEELEYQLLPRMLALAEVGWLPTGKKNWANFYNRLQSHDEILDNLGYTYAKHYIEPEERTADEQVANEAEEILANSIRGGVGYPVAEVYDALQTALTEGVTANIEQAITNYKNAPIVMPEPGKTYQIVSASTYYKRQYAGSTMYVYDNEVRFHYTPQVEPEELWQFVNTEGGYLIKNLYTGKEISMPTYNRAAVMADAGTPVKIEKATKPTKNITYVPGTVLISDLGGAQSDDSQLWKITGNETDGYTFTNKKGYTLCVSSAAKNKMVQASSTPSGVTKFFIKSTSNSTHSGGYEIHPKGNTNISMNLWGGSENRGVGLWDKGDKNNPVTFIEESEIGKSDNSGFPAISTDSKTKWYAIQFMDIKNAFSAAESGAQITTYQATVGIKRLSAEVIPNNKEKENWSDPCIYAKDVDALCYNGTWKIVEVTDYTAQLAGLVNKCELIVIRANEGRTEALTKEALAFIQNSIITPASAAVEAGNVTEEQYNAYVALYHQFQIKDYTTSIEKVKGENGKVKDIYDLSGRKVKNPARGIYIINNKKVLIK